MKIEITCKTFQYGKVVAKKGDKLSTPGDIPEEIAAALIADKKAKEVK